MMLICQTQDAFTLSVQVFDAMCLIVGGTFSHIPVHISSYVDQISSYVDQISSYVDQISSYVDHILSHVANIVGHISSYGSVSAGREFWPFRVIFFQKVEPSCD